MLIKGFFLLFAFFALELNAFAMQKKSEQSSLSDSKNAILDNHPFISSKLKSRIRPFLIPKNHPLKGTLDFFLSNPRVLLNEKEFRKAGFEIISNNTLSRVVVARHPAIQGYLLKVYLFENPHHRLGESSAEGLVMRCEGAETIKKFISKKNIRHFSVPQKYLYILPDYAIALPQTAKFHPLILVVEDMKIADFTTSAQIWRDGITHHHLEELYYLLSQGGGSTFLPGNIPYAKDKKFAFIDTEFPKRKNNLEKVKKYLSPKMSAFWERLIKTKGKP